ncbi:unnamed protein product [Acanthoscelides obtectus]|uniref:Transcription termination factor, mitochondrial n=1 Tax=Acanthoscelides obtectus TaxID=200917 RepID=A0A9P0P2E6_ACAOB|nr:unnamed protein product [Acanthoscelides obtectus]CAK1676790.1 Transcription termination factor, mitochondrial [Acanthoscelides obtectus]
MFTKLSNGFVQICARQYLNNVSRTLSNVQSKRAVEKEKKLKAEHLVRLLNIQKGDALNIVSKSSKLSKVDAVSIEKNHMICLSNGVTADRLQACPHILAVSDLVEKIDLLQRLPYNLDTTLPLVMIPSRTLKRFILKEDAPKRIKFLSGLFDVDEEQLCEHIAKRHFLITLKEEQIKDTFNVLLDFGISKEEIKNDLWVLKYSTDAVKNRFTTAKNNNVDKVKTWMVRAKPFIFDTYLRRRSEDRSILGHNSLVEYLSTKLECSEEMAKNIICKQPAIQHSSLKKLNYKIDILLANGFTAAQICKTPKLLLHSTETIMTRLKKLQALGTRLDFATVLIRSRKQYVSFYESLKAKYQPTTDNIEASK